MDPFQFAYRANRSVEDAVSITLHNVLKHLDMKGPSYARLLFIDFSSAFNTISPFKLHSKLLSLEINSFLCQWIFDFLSNRSQIVRAGTHFSEALVLKTGSPQGCVISPCLYCLFTADCVPIHEGNLITEFVDDITVAGLIRDSEMNYRAEIEDLINWCNENNLELNVSKTKDIIIDFRKNRRGIQTLLINGT